MRIYLLALFDHCSYSAKAQKKFSYIENYQHTINYADHKVTLQAPADRTLQVYRFNNLTIGIVVIRLRLQGGFSGKLLHGLYSTTMRINLQE
ncbi:hypothetical protein CS542_06440 [Pedobacter sp. IW39]|nr:hypothetical protein CS542_06440 [Pedobacter sp. IW39]